MLKTFQDTMLLARNDPAAYQAYSRERVRQLQIRQQKDLAKRKYEQAQLLQQVTWEEQNLRASMRAHKADMRMQKEKLREERKENMHNERLDTMRRLLARTEAMDITLAALLVEVRAARMEAHSSGLQEQTHRESLKDTVVAIVDVVRQEMKTALTSTLIDEGWDGCNEMPDYEDTKTDCRQNLTDCVRP